MKRKLFKNKSSTTTGSTMSDKVSMSAELKAGANVKEIMKSGILYF